MSNDNIHADMHDELALGAVLGEFVPGPDPEKAEERAAHRLLVGWTKRNKADDTGCQVVIDEGLDVVLVQRPDTNTLGLVMRERLGQFIFVERGMDIWLRADGTVVLGKPVDDTDAAIIEGPIDYEQVTPAARIYLRREQKNPYYDYRVLGVRGVEQLDQGKDIIRQIRSATEFKVARDIQGFGSTPVAPADPEPVEVGF